MFFWISKQTRPQMSQQIRYFHWSIDTDEGWQVQRTWDRFLMFKGYTEEGQLGNRVQEIAAAPWASVKGNFCILDIQDSGVRVIHNECRSFPLWYDSEQGLTNLKPLSHSVWADSSVYIDKDLALTEVKHDIIGELPHSTALSSYVVDEIDDIIKQKFRSFFAHNQLPVRIFLSGGIDTTLMWSYLKKLDIDHEIVLAEHLEFDRFWLRNHHTLTELNWAYKQIHHWLKPTVLVSGCPGDEFTLRNPGMANMLSMCHDGRMLHEIIEPDDLHFNYFNSQQSRELFIKQRQDPEVNELIRDPRLLEQHLLDRAANDHQHWHLGNTLTFTPLRDLEILKHFLSLPWHIQRGQICTSSISAQLIIRNWPQALTILSAQKNHENYLENLVELIP